MSEPTGPPALGILRALTAVWTAGVLVFAIWLWHYAAGHGAVSIPPPRRIVLLPSGRARTEAWLLLLIGAVTLVLRWTMLRRRAVVGVLGDWLLALALATSAFVVVVGPFRATGWWGSGPSATVDQIRFGATVLSAEALILVILLCGLSFGGVEDRGD